MYFKYIKQKYFFPYPERIQRYAIPVVLSFHNLYAINTVSQGQHDYFLLYM